MRWRREPRREGHWWDTGPTSLLQLLPGRTRGGALTRAERYRSKANDSGLCSDSKLEALGTGVCPLAATYFQGLCPRAP